MKQTGNILTVGEVTRRIKGALELQFAGVAIQGEISNYKRHTSGHVYFTLKDESAQIQCVLWRSRVAQLFFTPQDGMNVIAKGRITVYEVRGVYQLDIVQLQPAGIGELQLAFERLKSKLSDEGLFDAARKRPLPEFPEMIGIVTSPTGAAIQDILNVISRRFPSVQLVLLPVKVQGEGAAEEIAKAIGMFNDFGEPDLLIVGRGGGSIEDLWAFNEEIVARAIAASRIPVVSAVGHEVDFTIADFVADLRAPTPSAAAEMVVPDRAKLIEFLRDFSYTGRQAITERITSARDQVAAIVRSYGFNAPLDRIRQYSQRLDELQRSLGTSISHRYILVRRDISSFQQRLNSLNPLLVLHRGYAIVEREHGSVGSASALSKGDEVNIRFHDGRKPARIQ
jgi:exodeoxyribonuclease VII large subunit